MKELEELDKKLQEVRDKLRDLPIEALGELIHKSLTPMSIYTMESILADYHSECYRVKAQTLLNKIRSYHEDDEGKR